MPYIACTSAKNITSIQDVVDDDEGLGFILLVDSPKVKQPELNFEGHLEIKRFSIVCPAYFEPVSLVCLRSSISLST